MSVLTHSSLVGEEGGGGIAVSMTRRRAVKIWREAFGAVQEAAR